MKKAIKIIIILIVAVILAIDFYGLWKYKLNGKQYVLETAGEDDSADTYVEEEDNLEELKSDTLADDDVIFITNIEEKDNAYMVKATIYAPYEISKDDYNELRAGETVEILGETYKKYQIRNNSLILRSTETSNTTYYVKYDTSNKKYLLIERENDNVVYKSTEKNVKLNVDAGTTFVTVKNGRSTTGEVEDVVESHKDVTEPEGETGVITTCTVTFDEDGACTKITETVR